MANLGETLAHKLASLEDNRSKAIYAALHTAVKKNMSFAEFVTEFSNESGELIEFFRDMPADVFFELIQAIAEEERQGSSENPLLKKEISKKPDVAYSHPLISENELHQQFIGKTVALGDLQTTTGIPYKQLATYMHKLESNGLAIRNDSNATVMWKFVFLN